MDRPDHRTGPARPDLYVSADIETDGPIPGPYSMLSFGLALAGRFDGQEYQRLRAGMATFYRELRPISGTWEPEALAVNGLDREALISSGEDPVKAMAEAVRWLEAQAEGHRLVLVAYPVAFDWAFLYWYFIRFAGESPFGYSSCLDIRTLYQARSRTVHDRSGKKDMPSWMVPAHPHTHNALDDAIEQAELFSNVFEWAGSAAIENHATAHIGTA